MRIYIEASGGYDRIGPTVIDTTELSPARSQEIEELVEDADFFSLPEHPLYHYGTADMPVYEITIARGETCHSIAMSDTKLSSKVWLLVRVLKQEADR